MKILATSAGALRWLPPFENVSLRLLQDLIESATLRRDLPPVGSPQVTPVKPGQLWQVLEGEMEVIREPTPASEKRPTRRIRAGRYYLTREGDVSVAAAPGSQRILRARRFEKDWMDEAMRGSFTFARTMSAAGLAEFGGAALMEPGPLDARVHRILLTHDPDFEVPLETLAYMLAVGIGRQFNEPAAVLIVSSPSGPVHVWRTDRFEPLRAGVPADERHLLHAAEADLGCHLPEAPGLHFIVVARPSALPTVEQWSQFFHRVVYVTNRWEFGRRASVRLLRLLKKEAWDPDRPDEGPYFCSFIPTVILPKSPPTPAVLSGFLRPGCELPSLETIPIAKEADFTARREPIGSEWRLFRDLCRLRLDVAPIGRMWPDQRTGFQLGTLGAAETASIERWARAVTNRQVGVALSGGGAVNACLIPLLDELVGHQVPIDVVSGVSGGTVLGAFLCRKNPDGLRDYRGEGCAFTAGFLGATAVSTFFERVLDWRLGGERVEQLETRLVAITTDLRNDTKRGAIEAVAVIKGSLGEAIRASGAAPGLFGPVSRGLVRYLDGATSLAVPGRILPDFGADIAFGLNAIGSLRDRNLLRALAHTAFGRAFMDFVYHWPLWGRLVDGAVAQFALLQQASRADIEDVDVFYEAMPERVPIFEGFQWLRVDAIASEAEANKDDWKAVSDRCIARWNEFWPASHSDVPRPKDDP